MGGLLLSGAAVAAPTFVENSNDLSASSDQTSQGEPPIAASSTEREVSRNSERPGLSSLDDTAEVAADQVEKAADQAEKDAAAQAKKEKKAKAAAAEKQALEDAQNDPRGVAQAMLSDYGWNASQFTCLDGLWQRESGWDYTATNASSGAYGIPQSLPGSKMATAGADWKTNPATQIRWGLDYIKRSYGSPCSAQSFQSGHGWY